jgi:hypothetical protein
MASLKLSKTVATYVSGTLDNLIEDIGTRFGESRGGEFFDAKDLVGNAEFTKGLVAAIIAYAKQHGVQPDYNQTHVDEQIDETLRITLESHEDYKENKRNGRRTYQYCELDNARFLRAYLNKTEVGEESESEDDEDGDEHKDAAEAAVAAAAPAAEPSSSTPKSK